MQPDPYTQCVLALEYMATAVHAGDMSALQLAAFVWAQRGDYIIKGEESWADQHLPSVHFGGVGASANNRVRPVLGGPLSPPSPGDLYLLDHDMDDQEAVRTIIVAAVEASLAAAGVEISGMSYE